MTDDVPGPCPWCFYEPPGGFDRVSEPCPVCGVARDGTDGDGGHASVPVGLFDSP